MEQAQQQRQAQAAPAAVPAPAPVPAAPGAWQQAWDSTRGVPYYFNSRTGERRWHQPADGEPQLPVGWESAVDERRQRRYYYNAKTGERRWSPPPAAAAATVGYTANPLAAAGQPRAAFETERASSGSLEKRTSSAAHAQALDQREADGLVKWYHLWLLAIGLCALSLAISLSAAAALTIVVDTDDIYNIMLFAMLLAVAATSALGLFALLSRHRWGLLLAFAGCLLVLSVGQAWFAVELFTDNILPSRTTDDWAIYEHIRDSYRARKSCPTGYGNFTQSAPAADTGAEEAGRRLRQLQLSDWMNGLTNDWADQPEPEPEPEAVEIVRMGDVCTCKGDRFCFCSGDDGRQCVKDYLDRVQLLWTVRRYTHTHAHIFLTRKCEECLPTFPASIEKLINCGRC